MLRTSAGDGCPAVHFTPRIGEFDNVPLQDLTNTLELMIMIIMSFRSLTRVGAALVGGALLTLAACGAPASDGNATNDGKLRVVVSAYPFEYAVQRVAGDLVDLTNLLTPGADGHDLELSPQQIAAVGQADLVVYMGHYQAAFDEAVAQQQPNQVLDVADFLKLRYGDGHDHTGADDGHDHGEVDPHVWLDPQNMALMADQIARTLGELDPANQAGYQANAAAFGSDIEGLDAEFAAKLVGCRTDTFVTNHAAFGYLADRYGLEQVGIQGLSTDAEPSPARIAAVQQIAKQHDLTTIFYETAVSPKVAQTIASDLGLATDVLDPLETLSPDARGSDYLEVMTANLSALAKANGCQ